MPEASRQERLDAYLREDRERGFEFAAPLMRIGLHALGQDEYQFTWSFHHILLDGWSVGQVLNEVFALYEALGRHETRYIPVGPQYRDYIAWLGRQDRARAKTYWRDTLSGFAAPTPLPLKAPVKTVPVEALFGEQKMPLSPESFAALQSLAQKDQLTLNTLVQAAWALLLNSYSGDDDVVFGATVSGRPPSMMGVEGIVGLFINTLPVRVDVQRESSLRVWLQQLQQRQLEMREYEYSSLVDIQGWSDVPRGLPLFETLVIFENYPIDASLLEPRSDLRIRDFHAIERFNYPFTLLVGGGKELWLRALYDRRHFDDDAVTDLLSDVRVMLHKMAAADPMQKLAAILRDGPHSFRRLIKMRTDALPAGSEVAPHSAIEQVLVGIWKEVLGVDEVHIDDDFFDLGGHSLSAMQVMTRVSTEFRRNFPLRLLFEAPTVAGLAAALGQSE
jgi:acyl carrier protein